MNRLILIFGLLLMPLFAQIREYDIFVAGLPSAELRIEKTDTLWQKKAAKFLRYTVKTSGLSDVIFSLDNDYIQIVDSTFQLLHFEKTTRQPGLKNRIRTEFREWRLCYENSQLCIAPDEFTIFSFLDFIERGEWTTGEPFRIDREGAKYICYVQPDQGNTFFLRLQRQLGSPDPLLENTDLFTMAVFRNGAENRFKLDKNRQILECEFRQGFIKIRAILREK